MHPPRLALRFFRWFCHPQLRDSIEGDLLELYHERRQRLSPTRANIQFIIDVILLCRPGIIGPSGPSSSLTPYAMYKNYFKISWRQLQHNKTFTFIHLSGLTLGFSCFLLVALYLYDELSFDQFHRDASRMYRLVQHETLEDGTVRHVVPVAPLVGAQAQQQFQEIEDVCRLTAFGRLTLGNEPSSRGYERLLSTDANFFTFFDFPLVEGDPRTVLQQPDAIVISETFAKKYFGNESAMGKQLWSALTREGKPVYFTVTGIMKDFPANSHIQVSLIFSEATWPALFPWYNEYISTDWESNEYVTYVKVKPEASISALSERIGNLVKTNFPATKEFRSTYTFQPLADVHTQSNDLQIQAEEYNAHSLQPFYLYMFAAVGFLLLLIACLNYTNLATAAALKRTREIGTRKALGALRGQMIGQFTADALLLCGFALMLSIILVQLVLPFINLFTGKNMHLLSLPYLWMLGAACVPIVAALLSSLYPAWIAARISAVDALKREVRFGNSSVPVRKLLLAGQFAISAMMIASTLVIYQQLDYLRNKDLGFNQENLLVVDINSGRLRRGGDFEAVKAAFSEPAEVMSIATSTRVPGEWKNFPIAQVKTGENPNGRNMIFVGIDKDFLNTYGIRLLEGRTIDDPRTDSLKVVLTELAVQQLGLTNPIGQLIEIPSVRAGGSIETLESPFRVEVIGVVENFHFESLRQEMMPVIFGAPNTVIQRIDYYTLRIKTNNWSETIAKLQQINNNLDPENPLEYTFLDQRFQLFYEADQKRGQIFITLSIVVVLIACMGLFALVSYSIERRTKEIGIRKVLGASVSGIVTLVMREFLVLILAASVVGLPVAWLMMNRWLQEFAYRTPLPMQAFVLALLATLILAAMTVVTRTARAAGANPVKSLRSE